MNNEEIKDWFTNVLSGLVSKPDEIKIEEKNDDMGTKFTVFVADEDTGRVIGKKGTIAEALRVILRSVGNSSDVRISMVINAPVK